MKTTNITVPLDLETMDRLSAAAASCGVTKTHVAREVLRFTFGVVDPVRRAFGGAACLPPSTAGNRDAGEAACSWLNREGDHGRG